MNQTNTVTGLLDAAKRILQRDMLATQADRKALRDAVATVEKERALEDAVGPPLRSGSDPEVERECELLACGWRKSDAGWTAPWPLSRARCKALGYDPTRYNNTNFRHAWNTHHLVMERGVAAPRGTGRTDPPKPHEKWSTTEAGEDWTQKLQGRVNALERSCAVAGVQAGRRTEEGYKELQDQINVMQRQLNDITTQVRVNRDQLGAVCSGIAHDRDARETINRYRVQMAEQREQATVRHDRLSARVDRFEKMHEGSTLGRVLELKTTVDGVRGQYKEVLSQLQMVLSLLNEKSDSHRVAALERRLAALADALGSDGGVDHIRRILEQKESDDGTP